MNEIQSIIQHLESNPLYGISITNKANGGRLQKPNAGKNKYVFTKTDILKEHNSISDFIKGLYKRGFSPATIDLMRPNGTSQIIRHSIELIFKDSDASSAQESASAEAETMQLVPQQSVPAKSHYPVMASPAPYQPMGLSVPMNIMEVIDYKRNNDKISDLLEQNSELKEERQNLRSSIRRLEDENSTLKADLKVAETVKEIALQKKDLEKKSVLDNPGVIEGIKALAGALPMLLTKQQPLGLAGPGVKLSETKDMFIEAMKDERVTDALILNLHYTLKGMMQNETFKKQLETAFEQYNLIAT